MIHAIGERAAAEDPDILTQLYGIQECIRFEVVAAVAELRAAGHTWQSIGEATGTTRQAAIQKWASRISPNDG